MGGELIIAMVIAAGITHSISKGRRRAATAWADARRRAEERTAAREQERQQRAADWEHRFDAARTAGPKAALWWPYAVGMVLGGATSALAAGAVGAATGVVAGGRGGYRVGRQAARRGWGYRGAWREWRTSEREWIDMDRCDRCGGYAIPTDLMHLSGVGRVCPDCVPQPNRGHGDEGDEPEPEPEAEQEAEPKRRRCWWCAAEVDANSLDADGWCTGCARWHDSGGMDDSASGGCSTSDQSPFCQACTREWAAAGSGNDWTPYCQRGSDADQDTTSRIYVDSQRVDAQENTNTKEEHMTELMPVNTVAATGEGYADTIASLTALAKLLGQAHEEIINLGDMLTANSLDSETLGQISDLTDTLESAAPMAAILAKHVEARHAPVADAVAGAGGSGNVATKTWYDQY